MLIAEITNLEVFLWVTSALQSVFLGGELYQESYHRAKIDPKNSVIIFVQASFIGKLINFKSPEISVAKYRVVQLALRTIPQANLSKHVL